MSPALVPLALLLAAGAPTPHPAIENASADDCQACHAEATPEAVRQWESGRHGLLLVKCFVCHGSTGKDFARRPDPGRCEGCHAEEVASVVPATRRARTKPGDCFACHAPHALSVADGKKNPHAAR